VQFRFALGTQGPTPPLDTSIMSTDQRAELKTGRNSVEPDTIVTLTRLNLAIYGLAPTRTNAIAGTLAIL